MEGINIFQVNRIWSGQVGVHKDSIYEYHISKGMFNREQVEKFCTEILKPCKNNKQDGDFDGFCGFPFGMESFYSLKEENGLYIYKICVPYAG